MYVLMGVEIRFSRSGLVHFELIQTKEGHFF